VLGDVQAGVLGVVVDPQPDRRLDDRERDVERMNTVANVSATAAAWVPSCPKEPV
jgi:hypothetical protein